MISEKCIKAGALLLQWGIVSEKVLAWGLVESMRSDESLLQILLKNGQISVYQQLFVLMEESTSVIAQSGVAQLFSTLPTSNQTQG